jgi:F420-dependent oxidoreductase-like protein
MVRAGPTAIPCAWRVADSVGDMRFAFKTAPQHSTWHSMRDVWRAADDIEMFESGWTFDHFYPIFSDSEGPCLEGWTMLAALAEATRRLRLGVLVTGIHHRHPALLANMAATLDIISDGRLEIGLGAGWNAQESSAYGLPLGTARQRSDRLEEACAVVVGLLSDTTTTFHGTYFDLEEARCEPKPLQRPHPPICIGGNGERRTLRTAARFAQHWNFLGGSPEELRRKIEVLHGHCADIGRDPAEITISTHVRHAGDPAATAAAAAELADAGAELGIVQLPPPHGAEVLEPLAAALAGVG